MYLKTSPAFKYFSPFKDSPGSHSQSVRCSLPTFLLTVSLALSHLHYLFSSVSQILLLYLITPVLKAAIKSANVKSLSNNVRVIIMVHVITRGCTNHNKQTDLENIN